MSDINANGNRVNMSKKYLEMLTAATVQQNEQNYSLGRMLIEIDYKSKGINPPHDVDLVDLSVALLNTKAHFDLIQLSNLKDIFEQAFSRGELAPMPENAALQSHLMMIPGFVDGAGNACEAVADVLEDIFNPLRTIS